MLCPVCHSPCYESEKRSAHSDEIVFVCSNTSCKRIARVPREAVMAARTDWGRMARLGDAVADRARMAPKMGVHPNDLIFPCPRDNRPMVVVSVTVVDGVLFECPSCGMSRVAKPDGWGPEKAELFKSVMALAETPEIALAMEEFLTTGRTPPPTPPSSDEVLAHRLREKVAKQWGPK